MNTRYSSLSIDNLLVHIRVQFFQDALWVCITEDDRCAPGTVAVSQRDPTAFAPIAGDEVGTRGQETDFLLGRRDEPLTNVVVAVLQQWCANFGEDRRIVWCVSLSMTATKLTTPQQRQNAVRLISIEFARLAQGK